MKKRVAHYMTRNHSGSTPLEIICVDTETANEHGLIESGSHKLVRGAATYDSYISEDYPYPHEDRHEKIHFKSAVKFWEWALSKCSEHRLVYIFMHNVNFDGGILSMATLPEKFGYKNQTYINDGGPPVIMKFTKGEKQKQKKSFYVLDSMNWYPHSLKILGDSLGMDKLEMPDHDAPEKDWEKYVEQDVLIVRKAIIELRNFIRKNKLGKFRMTAASQAMGAYRHRFMKRKDILVHTDKIALPLERAAYHGGMTESYYRGKVDEKLWKLDVTSMYPAQMRNNRFSYRLGRSFLRYVQSSWDKALKDDRGIVARVDVKTPHPRYPVKDLSGRLIFPTGTFTTVLSTPEIKHAIENNHITKVYEWAWYYSGNIFRDYVDYFYGKRVRATTVAEKTACKLYLNSLYGKFGAKSAYWHDKPTKDPYVHVGAGISYHKNLDGEIVKYRVRFGRTQKQIGTLESSYSCPIIAAEITAYGREQLFDFIDEVDGKVYYCDTDSVVVNQSGFDRLKKYINKDLGGLKIEWEGNGGEFMAPKHYTLNGELPTIKGIKKNAKNLGNGRWKQELFTSYDKLLDRPEDDGYIIIKTIIKHLSAHNTKRIYTGDGWTNPISINEVVS